MLMRGLLLALPLHLQPPRDVPAVGKYKVPPAQVRAYESQEMRLNGVLWVMHRHVRVQGYYVEFRGTVDIVS